jgi:solute carrier family 25 S-adenosylmethionine transporter 26
MSHLVSHASLIFLILCSSTNSRPKMHHLAVDAICGAVGEVAGLVALYPLDTIKVKCQAANIGAGQALRETFALGPSNAIRTLYAGMGSTALGAAAIGSLYLLTFYAAKRAGTTIESKVAKTSGKTTGTTSSGDEATTSASPLVASAAGAAASIVGSILEAPIEAFKVRAQAGAGGSGSMLGSMATLVVTQGFAPLYCSFLPFLLKSIPHDVAELFTYSQINELAVASSSTATASELTIESTSATIEGQSIVVDGQVATNGSHNKTTALASTAGAMLSSLPIEARDMLIGAASGAAAAIASMPFDVTFTRMNLGTCALPTGAVSSRHGLASFAATVRLIVAQGGGPHALFAGVVPRLLQTVPAGMVYWAAVEATRRALESKYDIQQPSGGTSPSFSSEKTMAVTATGSSSSAVEVEYSSLSATSSDDEVCPSPLSAVAPTPEMALA